MFRPTQIRPLDGYKIWIHFEDGIEGEVDLSHLAGKGVFSLWNDYATFGKVRIGKHGELIWSKEVEICSDNIYLQLSGQKPEEIFGAYKREKLSA